MWTGTIDFIIDKTSEGFKAYTQDNPDLIGHGLTKKEALGDLVYKLANKTGKIKRLKISEDTQSPEL